MSTTVNPYSDRRTRGGGAAPGTQLGTPPSASYVVPSAETSVMPGYTLGYSTELDPDYESGTTPDAIRIGTAEPPLNDPNNRDYWRTRTAEERARGLQEEFVTGWDVEQHRVPPGQNPLWEQDRPNTRPTQDNSPSGYMHQRYWHIPRNITEAVSADSVTHISMADHRREYEIFGMRTHDRHGVHTFRVDPVPWDKNAYPPDQTPMYDFPATGAQPGVRGHRLG